MKIIPGGRSTFEDPLLRIPCEVFIDLLWEAERLLGRSGVGLKVGATFRPSTFLDFGYGLMSCDTLRSALAFNRTYQSVNQQLGRAALRETEDSAFVEWDSPFDAEYVRPATEAIMTGYVGLGRWMTWSRDDALWRLRFRHKAPAHASEVEAAFECPVLYSEPGDRLELDPSVIDQAMPASNPALVESLSRRLDLVLESIQQPEATTLATYRIIERSLADGVPSVQDVARSLGMSERTLRRRLADEDESYRNILKRVRRAVCEIYLNEETRSMSEIAQLLGYSEHSAFIRAFRGWFGMTPTQYLNQKEA